MVDANGIERSGRQGVHAQTVARCAYDEGPTPKVQKAYKWLANETGIKRSECNMQNAIRIIEQLGAPIRKAHGPSTGLSWQSRHHTPKTWEKRCLHNGRRDDLPSTTLGATKL